MRQGMQDRRDDVRTMGSWGLVNMWSGGSALPLHCSGGMGAYIIGRSLLSSPLPPFESSRASQHVSTSLSARSL